MIDWGARALGLIGGICWTQHCDDKDCKCQKDVVAALSAVYAEGREGSWAAGYKAGQASLRAEVEWYRTREQKP